MTEPRAPQPFLVWDEDEGMDTAERLAREQLAAEWENYQRRIRPLLEHLARIELMRGPRPVVVHCTPEQAEAVLGALEGRS